MNEDQIKHMVSRFLQWRLPENFNPDCGISAARPNYAPGVEWSPSGTNLFDAGQAEAMVRYMIDGIPDGSVPQAQTLSETQVSMIERHLALVFQHEIDPSMGDAKLQEKLNALHKPMPDNKITDHLASPSIGDIKYRC